MAPSFPAPPTKVDAPAPALADARLRNAIELHYDILWRFLRRIGVPDAEVEDAAQAVLFVFAQRLSTVVRGAERSFLLGTALRTASDVRKRHSRSREVPAGELLDDQISHLPSAEEQLDAHQRRQLLDVVLDALSEDLRAVLVLVDLEEQTMADTASILGIPPGTVASRLRSRVGRRTNFLIKNEREDQLVVFWVGLECEEKFWRRVGPKESLPIEGRDGDAWRVRTAKGGELVLDIAPEIADFRETITVP